MGVHPRIVSGTPATLPSSTTIENFRRGTFVCVLSGAHVCKGKGDLLSSVILMAVAFGSAPTPLNYIGHGYTSVFGRRHLIVSCRKCGRKPTARQTTMYECFCALRSTLGTHAVFVGRRRWHKMMPEVVIAWSLRSLVASSRCPPPSAVSATENSW